MYSEFMQEGLLSIVIPAYNEESALSKFLPELLPFAEENGYEVILVNDGSKDGTKLVLERFMGTKCFRAIHNKLNRGYGGAIKAGISACKTPYVITIDADGQHVPTDIPLMLKDALEFDADMVVGRRPRGKSVYRSMGKWIIRKTAEVLMPLPIRDLNSGIKLYRTELARRYIRLCPNGMAFSDIIALTFISGRHLVLERPVNLREREDGKSTVGTKTAFETLFEIINIVILFNPMKVFLPLSLFFCMAGLAWALPIVVAGKGVSVGSMLAIVVGGLLFMLGLLAEQISALRRQMVE